MATAQFNATQQIFLCTDFNPKREGTAAHQMFEQYFKSRTVGEFIGNGGTREAILWDCKHGYILLDWEGTGSLTADVKQAAVTKTVVRNGVKVSKSVQALPAPKVRATGKSAKAAGFFAEQEALKNLVAAKSGVRMENLVVRVVK